MNHAVNDDALSRCVCEAAEAMLAALPYPKDCDHVFSPAFEAKMDALCAKVRRREQWQHLARSAAAVFLAVVLGSWVFLSTNTQARAEFFSWVRELYESSIVYRFLEPYDPEAVLPEVEFGWLPEGYAEVSNYLDNDSYVSMWSDSDDERSGFILICHIMHSNTHATLLFNDNEYQYKTVQVNGSDADIYICLDGSEANELIWFNKEQNIIFYLSAYLGESVMLHIAESIILTE